MLRAKILLALILAAAWVVLMESHSLFTVASGLSVGGLCVLFSARFLPLAPMEGVRFGKIALYPLYLVLQIFASAAYVAKIVFKGAKIDIVSISTSVKNDAIRVMLADSVTLTPGSVMLEMDGGEMTVLWLRERGSPNVADMDRGEIAGKIMGRLEEKLIVAQDSGSFGKEAG